MCKKHFFQFFKFLLFFKQKVACNKSLALSWALHRTLWYSSLHSGHWASPLRKIVHKHLRHELRCVQVFVIPGTVIRSVQIWGRRRRGLIRWRSSHCWWPSCCVHCSLRRCRWCCRGPWSIWWRRSNPAASGIGAACGIEDDVVACPDASIATVAAVAATFASSDKAAETEGATCPVATDAAAAAADVFMASDAADGGGDHLGDAGGDVISHNHRA